MDAVTKKLVLKILKDTYNKIENDTCGLDDDEIMSIANALTHVKLNIEQACRHINCSRPTLYRLIACNKIPKPYKDSGGKEYWYQDELDEYIKNHK